MWQCYVLFFTAITSCEKNLLPQFASPSLSAFLYPANGYRNIPLAPHATFFGTENQLMAQNLLQRNLIVKNRSQIFNILPKSNESPPPFVSIVILKKVSDDLKDLLKKKKKPFGLNLCLCVFNRPSPKTRPPRLHQQP